AAAMVVAMSPLARAQDFADPAPPAPPAQPPAITTPSPAGLFKSPKPIVAAIELARDKFGGDGGAPKNGFYPEFSNMVSGAGWLAAGPGYRHSSSDGHVLFDG